MHPVTLLASEVWGGRGGRNERGGIIRGNAVKILCKTEHKNILLNNYLKIVENSNCWRECVNFPLKRSGVNLIALCLDSIVPCS